MPDQIEPTPEVSQTESGERRTAENDAQLTTASLARGGAQTPEAEPSRSFAPASAGAGAASEPLFAGDETTRLTAEWDKIQASFVDEPRQAVEAADHLVATAIKRLAEIFADEKGRLEGQWDRGDDVSTEDLRQALRRYRAFFGRVLSV